MQRLGGAHVLVGAIGLAALAGCSRAYVAPVLSSAYTEQIEAPYDAVWRALVRALARENVQIRALARDSGVIASEAVQHVEHGVATQSVGVVARRQVDTK